MAPSSGSEPVRNANARDASGKRSRLPLVMVVVAVGAVVAVMFSGPGSSSTRRTARKGKGDDSRVTASAGAPGSRGSTATGAIPGREADRATHPGTPRVIQGLGVGGGGEMQMLDKPPPEDPTERLAYYQKRLPGAQAQVAFYERAIERLPKERDKLLAKHERATALDLYAEKERISQERLDKAKARVEEIEAAIAELGG